MSKPNPLSTRRMIDPCPDCEGQGSIAFMKPCLVCGGSGAQAIVCRQCWNKKEPFHFRNRSGVGFAKTCKDCRDRNRIGAKMDPRRGLPDEGPLRVKLNVLSGNVKTGEVPVSMSSSSTCPTSCAHRGVSCYAESHFVGMHWRRLSSKLEGMTWPQFCDMIAGLPESQVWRHNEAGDLPGQGDAIDAELLGLLVEANRGRVGFTYTHKDTGDEANRRAILAANENGFTINLSADSLAHADALADLAIAPVAVTLPTHAPKKLRTPAGRYVAICPAQWSEVTCDVCQLCAKHWRKVIIGFWAHGPGAGRIVDTSFQLPLF